jgi:hypothetical protein
MNMYIIERFEVFMAVKIQVDVFWAVTLSVTTLHSMTTQKTSTWMCIIVIDWSVSVFTEVLVVFV